MKIIGNPKRRQERRIAQQAREIQNQADREMAERFLQSFHATTRVTKGADDQRTQAQSSAPETQGA